MNKRQTKKKFVKRVLEITGKKTLNHGCNTGAYVDGCGFSIQDYQLAEYKLINLFNEIGWKKCCEIISKRNKNVDRKKFELKNFESDLQYLKDRGYFDILVYKFSKQVSFFEPIARYENSKKNEIDKIALKESLDIIKSNHIHYL